MRYRLTLKDVSVHFDPLGGYCLEFKANGVSQSILLEAQRGHRWLAGMLWLSEEVPGIPEETSVVYCGDTIDTRRTAQHEELTKIMKEALATPPEDCPRRLRDAVELELDNGVE